MLGSCRLNNKSMRNVRRTDAYQAIAIDLALLGVISKEECEMLLDGGIPSGIVLPDGSSKLMSEKELPPKPDFIQTEPTDETPADGTHEPVDGALTDEIPVITTQDAGAITTDNSGVSPIDETPEVVSDGATTEDKPSVNPEPIPGVTVMPGDETQEPVNDEGRTESDN